VIAQPSLGEIAREVKADRAKKKLENVPLYTNDNLPTVSEGVSVIGPPVSSGSSAPSPQANLATRQKMAYLRGKLSQLQQHLEMHQRELSVLQQQLGQGTMQYYPNPYDTLMQEYSRQNVNNLASEVNQKKQQISSDQQEIQSLQDELELDQARYGLLTQAPAAGNEKESQTDVPPGLKPGTPEFWQVRIQAASQQLETAKEGQSLAKNELSLLKLQQLRTLDPNVQSDLAVRISAKQGEVTAAAQSVEKAQEELERLQKEAKASSAKSN